MKARYILAILCGMFLSETFLSAQNIQSIVGTYEVSEVCTLVDDTSYKESLDYTITLEAWQEQEYCMRFLIPAHGIPDFVSVKSINDNKFAFEQIFGFVDEMGENTQFLIIEGDGQVKEDTLLMEYVLNSTVAYGTLQCDVKGISAVSAQEITPNVVQEGRQWCFNRNVGGLNPEEFQPTGENLVFFLGADTVIDGKTYKDVLYKKVLYWGNFDLLRVRRRGTALREEKQKLYLYDYTQKTERVMCDFSLQPGDTIDSYEEFRVVATGDTVFYEGGKTHKYVKVAVRNEPNIIDFWVEDIGSLSVGIEWDECWCCPGSDDALLCCRDGNKNLYEKTENCLLHVDEATFVGKIAFVSEDPNDVPEGEPLLDCLWPVLQTETGRYFLMKNGVYDCDLFVDGILYEEGDAVEIRGIASVYMRHGLQSDLEILSIKKQGNVGLEPSQKAELRITPNPATETITLSAVGCALQKVEILDVNGRVLYAALHNTDSFRYNVSWLPSGLYLARVTTPCGVLTEKFSVK